LHAGIARAQIQKVIDNDPYVILGPVFSGSVLVTMELAKQAEIPEITGAEAAAVTQRGNGYVFRTSFGPTSTTTTASRAILRSMRSNT
jgi:branched-chain amino acid transport system substrate-binding protein